MQWSIRLGALKPAVLRQTEKTIWKAVLDIVNRPGDYMAILKRLASAFPSAYIRELEGRLETVPGWFNIDLQGDMVPSGTLVVGKTVSGEETDRDVVDNSAQDKDQAEASNSMDVDANDANDAGRGDLAGDTQTGSGDSGARGEDQGETSNAMDTEGNDANDVGGGGPCW